VSGQPACFPGQVPDRSDPSRTTGHLPPSGQVTGQFSVPLSAHPTLPMISWADHVDFYRRVLNPYATPEQIEQLRRQYYRKRQERVQTEVTSFWQHYLKAKLEQEAWYGTGDTVGATPFELFFFPVDSSYVQMPESRRILIDSVPLFLPDNLGGLNRIWFPAQWTQTIPFVYGYLNVPQATHLFETRPEKVQRSEKYV
jgi:hypothetical protein